MGLFKYMLRKGSGSPGATTRVMTENYYKLFYNGEHSFESAEALLNFRNNAYIVQGLSGIDESIIGQLVEYYYKDIPMLIFSMSFYENTKKPDQLKLFVNQRQLIYNVINEEYNKLCPANKKNKADGNDLDTDLLICINLIMSEM
tara:strand:- start:1127 stop:1561 length:435 start_codon:yes stop_codon:yes gene_type:complete